MFFLKKKIFHVTRLRKKTNQPSTTTKSDFSIFKGFIFGSLSGVFYAFTAVLVKYIDNLPIEQLALYRFFGIFFLSLPEAVKYRENIFGPKQFRLTIFIRSIFGATHVLLCYTAFRLLPLGEASVIIFSYPALVALFAKLFLKEPCGIIHVVILILTIIGISFIAKLPLILEGKTNIYTKETVYGLLAGVGSVILNTSQLIIVRKLKDVHHSVLMFNLGWVGLIETAVVIAITGHIKWHKCGIQGFLIILLGAFNYGSQIFITLALQGEFAAPVTVARSSADILLSFIFQTFFFRDIPDKYSIIGAVILGISFLLNGIKKWTSSPSE